MEYNTNLTVDDIADIKEISRLTAIPNSELVLLQKTVSNYEKNMATLNKQRENKIVAERLLIEKRRENEKRPWWDFSKYTEAQDLNLLVSVCSHLISETEKHLEKHESAYKGAKKELQEIDIAKGRKSVYVRLATSDERDEKFNLLVERFSCAFKFDEQREKATREAETAAKAYRAAVYPPREICTSVEHYVSNSEDFSRDIEILKINKTNLELDKKYVSQCNYYKEKLENQAKRTFLGPKTLIGKLLKKNYEAKYDKYNEMHKAIKAYETEHIGEVKIAVSNIDTLKSWGVGATGSEKFVENMIKEQEQVKTEYSQNTYKIGGKHITRTQPIFKPSAVLERNKDAISEATENWRQNIKKIGVAHIHAMEVADREKAFAENLVIGEITKINKDLESANESGMPLASKHLPQVGFYCTNIEEMNNFERELKNPIHQSTQPAQPVEIKPAELAQHFNWK